MFRTLHRLRAGATGIVATAALVLLASGCGASSGNHVAQLAATTTTSGTSSSLSPAASPQNGAVAFSGCMRSHGVSKFPDPNSSGAIPKVALEHLGVSSSQFRAAQSSCSHLLPNGGRSPDQAERQRARAQALEFARCMRNHGVPNFPDPGNDGRIPDPATSGINQGSRKFEAGNQACRAYRPPYIPSNAAYNAYARTQG